MGFECGANGRRGRRQPERRTVFSALSAVIICTVARINRGDR
jgi:hypothetical protein